MSDRDLDKEWKPNGRPQSQMAQSFATSLDDIFGINSQFDDLDTALQQKKQEVSFQSAELKALEARLKATEERLRASKAGTGNTATNTSERPPSPDADARTIRPDTKRQPSYNAPPMPGRLPPTPGASEDGEEFPSRRFE